jgi:hypothetical protein
MTTHITKTWFDGEKVVTQEIPESEVYKQAPEVGGRMTRDDIIRMAREAGFNHPSSEKDTDYYKLDRFAALVAAAEREALIALLKGIDQSETESPDGWWETSTGADFGAGILAAIRARGERQ